MPRTRMLQSYYIFISSLLIVCLSFGCDSFQVGWMEEEDEEVEKITNIEAVLGQVANLPCDIESTDRDHRVYMVLWFRENDGTPIYSFDIRGRPDVKALHWSDQKVFGPRAKFITGKEASSLQLGHVQLSDEGLYRCRVDFKSAPTRNFQLNLTVIVPPHQLIVYDNSGKEVKSTLGPLTEGSDIALRCEVRGGKPQPVVSWYVNSKRKSGLIEHSSDNKVISNKIEISKITRWQLNTIFTCEAINTDLVPSHRRDIKLDMNLKPYSVKIFNKSSYFVSNKECNVTCIALGSKPSAQITWWKHDRRFTRAKIVEFSNETETNSMIIFSPKPEDDGHTLRCRAENTMLSNSTLEDSMILNVLYPPIVTLHLGNSLNATNIKEGDDVYFECKVKSNPPQYRIKWFHNDLLVNQNISSGIILSAESLVLQNIAHARSGYYYCEATNDKGESKSNTFHLRVQYVPRCVTSEVYVVGASMQESLRVICRVDADPNDLKFFWQFNNSAGENLKVQDALYRTINKTSSLLNYKWSSELEYGFLSCWADNVIGRQLQPCVFRVVPATIPPKLFNCTSHVTENITRSWLIVECDTNNMEGLPHLYHLNIFQENKSLINITTRDYPIFSVDISSINFMEASLLQLVLYITNVKGSGEKTILNGVSLRRALTQRTEQTKEEDEESLVVLIGSFGTIGLLLVVFAVVTFRL